MICTRKEYTMTNEQMILLLALVSLLILLRNRRSDNVEK